MKKELKRTLAFVLALLPCLSVYDFASLDGPDDIPIKPIHIGGTRPRSIDPECYYQSGCVYITCDTNVASICGSITRLSDNAQWNNSSTSNNLQIAVSTETGMYHLTFTLSDGNAYYGDYELTY